MAIPWLFALKAIPWDTILANAPSILRSADELVSKTMRRPDAASRERRSGACRSNRSARATRQRNRSLAHPSHRPGRGADHGGRGARGPYPLAARGSRRRVSHLGSGVRHCPVRSIVEGHDHQRDQPFAIDPLLTRLFPACSFHAILIAIVSANRGKIRAMRRLAAIAVSLMWLATGVLLAQAPTLDSLAERIKALWQTKSKRSPRSQHRQPRQQRQRQRQRQRSASTRPPGVHLSPEVRPKPGRERRFYPAPRSIGWLRCRSPQLRRTSAGRSRVTGRSDAQTSRPSSAAARRCRSSDRVQPSTASLWGRVRIGTVRAGTAVQDG